MHGIVRQRGASASSAAAARVGALTVAKGQPQERAGRGGSEATATPASRFAVIEGETLGPSPWPDAPDDVPQFILAAERRRAEVGITQPLPARTRREFDAAVARCEAVLAAQAPRKVAPDEAARRFVSHIRSSEQIELSDEALSASYSAFTALHRIECPDNFFRAALKRTPGARRHETVSYQPRRVRKVVWVFAAVAASVSKVSVADQPLGAA